MSHETIVICEDDPDLGEVLQQYLLELNYNALLTNCSEELDLVCASLKPDVLLLDIQLPGESGIEIAKRYHTKFPAMPILMMSIQNSTTNQLNCFESGAMIFLPKPFQPEALKAALRGIFSQTSHAKTEKYCLNLENLSIEHGNETLALSVKEAALLKLLMIRKPKTVETYELLEAFGGDSDDLPSKGRVEVLISRLRRKLQDNNIDRQHINIKSDHGIGYSVLGDITFKH